MRQSFLWVIVALAVAGLLYFLFRNFNPAIEMTDLYSIQLLPPAAMTPTAVKPMSLVVDDSLESILQSLESELEKHDPEIIHSLRPGTTPGELDRAERNLGQAIHPEIQSLYRWHNGLEDGQELFPGHEFWSLEDAIQTNQEVNQEYLKKGVGLLMEHEKNWLVLFPDNAGDGYYYDPVRQYDTGGVFYNFREAGYYRVFPSLKNLLKAIVECYQKGAYPQGGEPDFELEGQIMDQYGLEKEGW